jgi:hypothetical protein
MALSMISDIVECPVPYKNSQSGAESSNKAKVFISTASNTGGGWDPDLATYDSDAQFRNYQIATCSNSLFTMYGMDLVKLTETERILLTDWFQDYKKNLPLPQDISTWQRYEIASDVYRKLGYDSAFLAELYMTASWTIRDDMVGVHRINGPEEMEELLEQGEKELVKKSLTEQQKKMVLYNLARVAHRFGDEERTKHYITLFEKETSLSKEEQQVATLFRQSIEYEKNMRQKALQEISKIPESEKTMIHLLWTAEILRRRGELEDALPIYKKLSRQKDYPQIQKIALFFSNWEPK